MLGRNNEPHQTDDPRMVRIREDDIPGLLVAAWTAAARTYRAEASVEDGRRYMQHVFDGPLAVTVGSITALLICRHPAVTMVPPSLGAISGEARLQICDVVLDLEFDGGITGKVDTGWQRVRLGGQVWTPTMGSDKATESRAMTTACSRHQ